MRGNDIKTHWYGTDDDYDDERDRCAVGLDSSGDSATKAIAELGAIFDPMDVQHGQGEYCDWACDNGAELVKALAAFAQG